MAISVVERVVDVAFTDFDSDECTILDCGWPNEIAAIGQDTPRHREYKDSGRVLRWYFGLMGETEPDLSPLSVDVAGDKDYKVFRYDWVFGVSMPNVDGTEQGDLWWDWQSALGKRTPVTVQLMIQNRNSAIGYTCVASDLNVLPPSRDTTTWFQRNQGAVIDLVKSSAGAAEKIYPGMITKAVAALSNSLDVRGKWKTTNWFIYQFLDPTRQACGVEWRINKQVLAQYGPVLRGTLVMAFHGPVDPTGKRPPLQLLLRPQLGFNRSDEFKRKKLDFDKAKEDFKDKDVLLNVHPKPPKGNQDLASDYPF